MKWLISKENHVARFFLCILALAIVACVVSDIHVHDKNLQKEPIVLAPELIEGEAGTRTVYIDLDEVTGLNNTLLFYTNHQIINAYIDGELVYTVQKSESPFARTTGAIWNFLELPVDAHELMIHFTPVYTNVPILEIEFLLGNGVQMYKDLIDRSLADFLLSALILIIGLIMLFYWLVFLRKGNLQRDMMYLGIFASVFGFWTVNENQIMHVVITNRPIASYLAFTCLMTMALPFMMFVREFMNTKDKWFHKIIMIYIVINTLACQILHLTGIMGVKQTVTFSLVGVVLTLVYLVYAIISVLRDGEDKRKAYVNIVGIIVLIAATIIDTSSYFGERLEEGQSGNIGFLLYAIILGAETVGRAQESIRERQKLEIYREMAEKDMLTNCYNRNAYNEDIAKITDLEESQILVFDLNNLKKRNDTQGHIAGDKYIVEAADIIYDIFGELGKVYRVGGDEFCVLTKNIPVEVIERDKKRLMKEIIRCRKEEWDDDFGIACGYAKYDAEVDKSIEDMRNRADVEMYYNKKEIKK